MVPDGSTYRLFARAPTLHASSADPPYPVIAHAFRPRSTTDRAPQASGGRSRMFRHRMSLLCLGVMLASPASAQIMGKPIELSAQAGWNHYDLRSRMQDARGFGGS